MLTHLHIENFTLVDTLNLEFFHGLTSVTGETGAGKSITLDALALALGDRADADKVRSGEQKADIQATFDISNLPLARKRLKELEIEFDSECILRRTITKQGRSRAFINGVAVTLGQLKNFGESLIDIHSQHEHQSLLANATHRYLLDNFADAAELTANVRKKFAAWNELNTRYRKAKSSTEEANAQYQLLSYQVEELVQLDIEEREVDALEQEQKEQANAVTIAHACEQITYLCDDEQGGISASLQKALGLISSLPVKPKHLGEAENLLHSAVIHIDEAKAEIHTQSDSSQSDGERLAQIEQRLSNIYEVARKHRVHPSQLYSHACELQERLDEMTSGDELLEDLEKQRLEMRASYASAAQKLSTKRKAASKKLVAKVNEKLELLSMANATFAIDLVQTKDPTKHGAEDIHFLIATQPGAQPKPLNKIASGGELSRISLAIQVVTAQTCKTPTLVFDEVDVGIGGTTGDIVGELLHELGKTGQVICVTHLAQVASKAHNHLLVDKVINKKTVSSNASYLVGEQVVLELARMMGGDTQSSQSLAHAQQMLDWQGMKTQA